VRKDLSFRSDVFAQVVDSFGSDEMICKAARVSTIGSESLDSKESSGLINYLMTNKHGSPFEHGGMTVLVECPIFVSRELVRHRTLSFNETSGRYRELEPVFYSPPKSRPNTQVGKPGNYILTEDSYKAGIVSKELYATYSQSWESYMKMKDAGVANEVARMALPVSLYTSLYVTGNPRAWMKFLELRYTTQAMKEIRDLAVEIIDHFSNTWPITFKAFKENGYICP
jgi:thymidylate synthase (FAD)